MPRWKDIKAADDAARKTMSGEITPTEQSELVSARAQLREAEAARKSGDIASAKHSYEYAKKTIDSIPD